MTEVPQHSDAFAERKAALELAKAEAELRAKELEVRITEQKLEGKEIPSRWEITKTAITWLGIVVPAIISVFGYLNQRERELELRENEAHDRRVAAIKEATDLIDRGDRGNGIFRLSSFGEDAIPMILGELRVPDTTSDWPAPALAAIAALRRIGVDKLKTADVDYMRTQGDLAASQIASAIDTYHKNSPASGGDQTMQRIALRIVDGSTAIIRALEPITGKSNEWDTAIARARDLKLQ